MTGNRLDNRAAVVTGAADGIGEGIARRFAAEGAAVVVADYDDERGPAVARDLRGLGARAEFIRCDVSRREDVIGAVDLCVERFGSVDILVNNAYRGEGPVRIEKKTDERFDEALRMCLFATKWAMERALPHMKAKGWGRVINMASLNGVNAHMAPQVAAATAAANPMGRMGDPESDIGGVAAFLASEDARYLTGNTLFVDGGGHINGVPWVPDFGPED